MSKSSRDITLCAIDCINPQLAARALQKSMEQFEFKTSLLLSNMEVAGDFRCVSIGPLRSIQEYSQFVLKDLNRFIDTEFVLLIQWDGYVIDGPSWSDDFLAFDYIGARWTHFQDRMTVGNGGFSLRSKRLLEVVSNSNFAFNKDRNEDLIICRDQRAFFEGTHKIRFADEKTANRFSYESASPSGPTFGFHGFFNMWRYLSDDELLRVITSMDSGFRARHEFCQMVIMYFLQCKFQTFRKLYAMGREALGDNLDKIITGMLANPPLSKQLIDVGSGRA